jgi:hypothetical protein
MAGSHVAAMARENRFDLVSEFRHRRRIRPSHDHRNSGLHFLTARLGRTGHHFGLPIADRFD